ncbi:hypothetical protein ACIRPX_24510 [Streptomyces sp. NPDC101225]|uniref:hypothetical protein n=1 Tax=Streptomyces sp. NPDC101225 TaxID=3366135 RepID=UPI003830D02E
MMRTAAGRRALQVVVLVGGLFTLGFLCGEQAHAAEAAPLLSASSASSGAAEGAVSSEKAPSSEKADPTDSVRSLLGGALGTVDRLTHAPTAPAAPAAHSTASAADPEQAPPADPEPAPPANPKPAPPADPKPAPPADSASDSDSAPAPTRPAPTHPAPESPDPSVTDSGSLTGALTRRGMADPVLGHPGTAHPVLAQPGTAGPVLGQLADQLVRTVGEGVVQPVGDLVGTVTAELGQVTAQIPPLASLPAVPVPGTPSLPLPSTLPGLPALPGHTLPAPVVQAPQPGDAGQAAEAAVDGRRSAAGASGTAFGPQLGADLTKPLSGTTRGLRAASAGRAPATPHPAPDSDPADELASRAAVDNGGSRHGGAHAVTLDHRAPVLFVAGSAARADAAGTRDRHRDIPVFPG